MKLFKGNYNWETTAHGKELNGEEIKNYLDLSFMRGSEPVGNELSGKLIFRSDDGTERECFFSSYRKKDGTVKPKMVLKEPTDVVKNYMPTNTPINNMKIEDVPTQIDDEDLPW